MKGSLERAFGYQGDNMNLPVPDLSAALPFYETILGFEVVSRDDVPHLSVVLARDVPARALCWHSSAVSSLAGEAGGGRWESAVLQAARQRVVRELVPLTARNAARMMTGRPRRLYDYQG